ncbi:MAG: VWA domain-containing protein [Gammaproteobacteria bacterium]
MKKKRRDIEGISLSFLDTICCGFGAIILLLVLIKIGEPLAIEQTRVELDGLIAKLQEELKEIEGETNIVNRDLEARLEQLSEQRVRVARLQGDRSSLRSRFQTSEEESSVADILEERLLSAKQTMTEEMRRLLANYQRPRNDTTVGGIPVDSEYIIFIIDTSGSMYNFSWSLVIRKFEETLNVYPQVKGIQIMNDMGSYMFTQYAGKWIRDTPARRRIMIDTLKNWAPFSNSSPVEGITKAIRTYYRPGQKISLYVFGDEFTGDSIENVLRSIDRINQPDPNGERLVRIHGVGFPIDISRDDRLQYTNVRFATLMRLLCARNGGTFVGLHKP